MTFWNLPTKMVFQGRLTPNQKYMRWFISDLVI